MILYHGTSTEHLDDILKNGLQPRLITGQKSNWEGGIQSKPDFVYLSDAYPVYFASSALSDETCHPVVLKVEVQPEALFPDEDFVAYQLTRKNDSEWQNTIAKVDPADYQHLWKESLRLNGNVCTPAVPPASILEHRVLPMPDYASLLLKIGADSQPTPINFAFKGHYYRDCTAAIFRYRLEELDSVADAIYEHHERQRVGDEEYERRIEVAKRLAKQAR